MLAALQLGPHAVFIVLAYAFAALAVAMLIVWIALDHRQQRDTLRRLEESGITRRSARKSDSAP